MTAPSPCLKTSSTARRHSVQEDAFANSNKKYEFKANDHVVYPTHGVGKALRHRASRK